ncbi:capsule assembly Wzi family protein [Arcicella sp. DC2W]|uniref:Capsule assembly Wzi family protein n=1 Tax=Arcicella gelida TaxID=2984195 RepID=A0ABU5S7W9_9BACT|nr:capsule assembly Wzi family protein [Arcicella sp. DC2W]MEA5404552.1 capsule assembly Wzi family protein [Arcicella sp. DC2W]
MRKFTKLLTILTLPFLYLLAFQAKAQVVYEPSYKTVYPFLSRLAQKGVIDLNDVTLPLSRNYILSKLDTLNNHTQLLTSLEKEELVFYLKEYTIEKNLSEGLTAEKPFQSILQAKNNDRIRFAAYQDKQFAFNIQPIIGYQVESIDNASISQRWIGAWIYGYLGKSIGYSVDFRNSQLNNLTSTYDYKKNFSPDQGRIGDLLVNGSRFDFSTINASITAQWKWGHATFGKTPLTFGYGTAGKLILSEKAPTYPQIRLDINPVKWLSFTYAHGWLNSNLVDSSSIYATSVPGRSQFEYRGKYLAFHALTLKPLKGLSFSIGESTIYNDNIKLAYLIPIALFSGMNHYLGEASSGKNATNTISNSQIFLQLSSRNHIPKTHLYGSFFVDEIELSLTGGNAIERNNRNHTAYQVGASISDFPVNNLNLTLEYTKVQPFTYVHFIEAQTYQNSNNNLGYWTGANSDQLFAQFHYRVLRGLDIKLMYNYIRKGAIGSGQQQTDFKTNYPFLWGTQRKYDFVQAQVQYEFVHDLFFKLNFLSGNNTNTISNTNSKSFSMSVNYSF